MKKYYPYTYEVWKVSKENAERVFETNFYSVALQALKEYSQKLTKAEIDFGYRVEVREYYCTIEEDIERPYKVVSYIE